MDIEEFIEQDVLVYLDKVLEDGSQDDVTKQAARVASVFLTRDYEKELAQALEDDNITKAKKVLHDLKKKFDEIPPGTSDKEDVKTLLTDLYERFREHVGGEKIARHPPPAVQTTLEPAPNPVPEAETVHEPPVPQKDGLVAMEAVRMLAQAEENLGKNDLKAAVQSYREAKRAALSMDAPVSTEMAMKFKQVFARIKERLQGQSHLPPVHPVQSSLDEDLLLQLEREKQHLDSEIHTDDMMAAQETFARMKIIVQQMQDHERAERAAQKMIKINEILKKMQAHHMVKNVP